LGKGRAEGWLAFEGDNDGGVGDAVIFGVEAVRKG
jgi:hypothetical protein